MTARILLPLVLLLGACNDEDDTSETGTPTDDTGPSGFTVKGMAINLLAQAPAAEGLCVYAADPTPCLDGDCNIMDSVLVQGTVGTGGMYELKNIETDSAAGLLLLVQDCAAEGTVWPSATGMAASTYSSLADGDVIPDYNIYSLDTAAQTAFQAGLTFAGYTGALTTDGAMLGFVFDSAGAPVDGAMVAGPKGTTTYYYAGPKVGFLTTGTVAAAGALFVIPGAPIYTYTCTATGYTFDTVTAGSQPGYAVIVKFNAQ